MLVTAHAISDLRKANEAWDRARRRLEVLERYSAHLGIGMTVPRRARRIRAALTAFYEAEATLHTIAEREHRWYMAHRRVRGRVLEHARQELAR